MQLDNATKNITKQKFLCLMCKTIAVHLCYKSLYISLPSSTKQEREMNKSPTPTECGDDDLFLVFPFRIEFCCCIVTVGTLLEPLHGVLKRSR